MVSRIEKDTVRVRVIIAGYVIEADYHKMAGGRMTDSLNSASSGQFVPLTNVEMMPDCSANRGHVWRTDYLALSRAAVLVMGMVEQGDEGAVPGQGGIEDTTMDGLLGPPAIS